MKEDGLGSSNQHSFQQDCRNAYHDAITRIGKTIFGIVKREKDLIDKVIKSRLPNMEEKVERKIDRNAVLKLMEAADRRNKTERAADRFLHDRGLDLDSHEAQKGYDLTHWKFWLPLLVMLIIELFANYIFLEGAGLVIKLLYAVTSVVVIFFCALVISLCLKVKTGIRVRCNKFRMLQKFSAWAGVVLMVIIFALALLLFIFSRAGTGIPTATEILPKLVEAFTNNIPDAGLAALNIMFLLWAIATFSKEGWRIHKYGNVAQDMVKHIQEHKQIRADMNNQARTIFDTAIVYINRRQEKADEIERDWPTIKDVCEQIPNTFEKARNVIAEKYELSIKKYREGFEKRRIPNPEITSDLSAQIPNELRPDSSIDTLTGSMQGGTLLKAISEMDFSNDITEFRKKVGEWENANNKFDKLSNFAQQRIAEQKRRILQEGQDDGIESSIAENEQTVDER